MLDENLVTIVLTTYNSEKFIDNTIKSVINQTYKNWELLVVDDYSKDNTVKILKKYSFANKKIKLFLNNKNRGCNYSRNFGIKNAGGRYLALLDHDDLWLKNKLKKQLSFHKKNHCSMSCTYYRRYDKNGKIGSLIKAPYLITYNALLNQNFIGLSTAMIDLKQNINFHMIDLPLSDFPTWLKLLKDKKIILTLEEDLMRYFYDNSTSSANKFSLAKQRWHIIKNVEKISTSRLFYCFTMYFFKSLFKYAKL